MKTQLALFVFIFILYSQANANGIFRTLVGNPILKACLFDTAQECEENDCIWRDKCLLPDLPGEFCLDLSKEDCDDLHVCRWSGKRCIAKTPCDVKCESFEDQVLCQPANCVWDDEIAMCFKKPRPPRTFNLEQQQETTDVDRQTSNSPVDSQVDESSTLHPDGIIAWAALVTGGAIIFKEGLGAFLHLPFSLWVRM